MKEIHPGIYEASLDDVKDTKLVGNESMHDYGDGVVIQGTLSLLSELSKNPEFKSRAVAIAVFNESNKMSKVFWYTGQHIFPKEYLELAVDSHNIVVVLTNMPNPTLTDAEKLTEVFLPKNENTNLDYNVLDYIWSNHTHGASLMCEDFSCCPKEGYEIEQIVSI